MCQSRSPDHIAEPCPVSRLQHNSTSKGVRLLKTGDTANFFASSEGHAKDEWSALLDAKRAEVRSVDVVYHSVQFQAVISVRGFDSRGIEIAIEGDFLFVDE